MFPPKKNGPPSPQGPGGPPKGAPGMDLMSLLSGGGMGGPGGGMPGGMPGGMSMPGMGGPAGGGLPQMFGGGPGMPSPGKGMNAMQAMQGGIMGPPPPPSPMGVNGPNGLPIGATDPGQGSPDQFGGSDLLSLLSQPSGGGMAPGDQYDQPPGMPSLQDPGQQQDDGMGGLMSMLAMAGLGIDPSQMQQMDPMAQFGGGPPPGLGGMGGPAGGSASPF